MKIGNRAGLLMSGTSSVLSGSFGGGVAARAVEMPAAHSAMAKLIAANAMNAHGKLIESNR